MKMIAVFPKTVRRDRIAYALGKAPVKDRNYQAKLRYWKEQGEKRDVHK